MIEATRFSRFLGDVKPRATETGRWVTYSDYKNVAELLEAFVEVYSEAPLEGSMVEPGEKAWRRYYELSGQHMILTDEGWEPGESKASYIANGFADWILDEVNAPHA